MADVPCYRPEHYFVRESDGVQVCQICGAVKAGSKHKQAQASYTDDPWAAEGWTPDTSKGFPPGLAYEVGAALARSAATIPNRQETL